MQQQIADKVKVDIVDNPDDAGKPEVAAKIFAAFLAKHRSEIEKHMEGKDYRNARKVVNNAALGLDVFSKAIDDFEKKFLQPPAPSEHLNILQPPPPVPAP
jgi:predicted chitinase